MSTRTAYTGSSRKVILAFDVGTTFSGISYSILDPGQVPEIKGVTRQVKSCHRSLEILLTGVLPLRFPAQENVGGDSKIPTIIYYDQNGTMKAAGAEAIAEGIEDSAEENGWIKAEWFKLHLRPKTQSAAHVTAAIPPLPLGKSAIDVLSDFLRYLYRCARTYIEDTHANGADLWRSVEKNIDFVLTHPNGWEGHQQSQMRRAAVLAGLVPDDAAGQSRITFVTEGEASLHYCIQSGLTTDAMKKGEGVLIVDAGGGTIDISAYGQSQLGNAKVSFEEIAAPQCYFKGSIFVTHAARVFLEQLLHDSKYVEDVDHIKRCFDKTTKLRFRNVNDPQYIKFGSARDKDLKVGIRSGQLKLQGSDVASFFEPSVKCITQAIVDQRNSAPKGISSVFLVGGFAASDWLFSRLKDSLEKSGMSFCRPDSHVNKAVADGAVSFYLDHSVRARVAKFAYGTPCQELYDTSDPEHTKRLNSVFITMSGHKAVRGAFDVILPKDTRVCETEEFRRSYSEQQTTLVGIQDIKVKIECYRGDIANPRWRDTDTKKFSSLCFVNADLSVLCKNLQPLQGPRGKYYTVYYDIILLFGLTELKAQISWVENGVEKRSSAQIVYDPNVELAD
ncbi:hypothetical protein BDQ12DRAFT_738725 [Crucibulum laeve]|uniref:Actin-like ATPase domain-containing protein n=1 Tax=Crucibulum laeve TaxID=68775 RepID=A0A5C3LK92_9AGAR|nr:hypothetical protein BDQ12DRAFT_738725 [Crucibulum laeve]